ncbi:MAG: hypothetical protein IKO98_04230 [Bacteroidales bacterium]|nr:hypothetical protein [Bacteroidales bacterium]
MPFGAASICLFLERMETRREEGVMDEETCILCGRPCSAGLKVMGCLICFPCEKRLLRGRCVKKRRRRLLRIFQGLGRA